tara:strand:- start:56 stop:940 length:885 start_codon:yes stop_codon:yes gene_type:complete
MDVRSSEELPKKTVSVNGKLMAYSETGSGEPILLLHGNPTSSYLWRNIIPHLADLGRCIAPDLIGMGDSEKLNNSVSNSYRFIEHRKYLDGFIDELELQSNLTLVLHDWGSALGFDWARRHPDAIKGIAYMEAIVRPLSWNEWNTESRPIFEGFRSPAGEVMALEKNIFVERILPGSILRPLTEAELAIYRRPFVEPGEGRRPTLTWPREIPIEGNPKDVTSIVLQYARWLTESKLPKLFINAEPGAILVGAQREFCRSWPNQNEITVTGSHFIQEDSPDSIGAAIFEWLRGLS